MFLKTLKDELSNTRIDISVYVEKRGESSFLYSLLYFLTCHGLHMVMLFRFGKVIYAIPVPILSHLLKIIYRIVFFILSTLYGISLNPISKIGPGFYIGHYGGIFIRGDFGAYCSIGQGVTFGSKGAGKSEGWPVTGDNVYVGAGAKIIGDISIGNNVRIGANAVVVKNIPDDMLAVGVPAVNKMIKI